MFKRINFKLKIQSVLLDLKTHFEFYNKQKSFEF